MKPIAVAVISIVGIILTYLIVQNLRLGKFRMWLIQTAIVIVLIALAAFIHNEIECGDEPPPFCAVDLSVYYIIALAIILIIQQFVFWRRNRPS